MKTRKLYKVLVNGASCHGGSLKWSLPSGGRPGKWHSFDGELALCRAGLHLTSDYTKWLKVGCEIYKAEADREVHDGDGDKIVCAKVRLLSPVSVPKWWRSVERFVASIKDVPFFQMTGAARPEWKVHLAPTWDAASAAAWDAASAAAWDAASAAAWGAASAAARAAASAAAWGAASSAARDAASAAARAAASAAAWDAASSAAWDAALYARMLVVPVGKLEKKHADHIKARWDVWQRGYGLLCDINGKLIVYGIEKK